MTSNISLADMPDPMSGEPKDIGEILREPFREGERWLLAVTCAARPDGDFTVRELDAQAPCAFGGSVVVCLADGNWLHAGVAAVVAGTAVPVAAWAGLSSTRWPETVRPAVAFAMRALPVIGEHFHLGALEPVSLGTSMWDSGTGFPELIRRVIPRSAETKI
jgi:hypothetical protein